MLIKIKEKQISVNYFPNLLPSITFMLYEKLYTKITLYEVFDYDRGIIFSWPKEHYQTLLECVNITSVEIEKRIG